MNHTEPQPAASAESHRSASGIAPQARALWHLALEDALFAAQIPADAGASTRVTHRPAERNPIAALALGLLLLLLLMGGLGWLLPTPTAARLEQDVLLIPEPLTTPPPPIPPPPVTMPKGRTVTPKTSNTLVASTPKPPLPKPTPVVPPAATPPKPLQPERPRVVKAVTPEEVETPGEEVVRPVVNVPVPAPVRRRATLPLDEHESSTEQVATTVPVLSRASAYRPRSGRSTIDTEFERGGEEDTGSTRSSPVRQVARLNSTTARVSETAERPAARPRGSAPVDAVTLVRSASPASSGRSNTARVRQHTETLLRRWPPTDPQAPWKLKVNGDTRCIHDEGSGNYICLTRTGSVIRPTIGNTNDETNPYSTLEAALAKAVEVFR